jgi:S-layer protein (TIGR01567 family)
MVVGAVDNVEVRGKVASAGETWTAQNFAGFYYDIDDDIGTETLTTVITDNKLNEPDGVTYSTKAEAKEFDFDAWGQFNVIGFLAEKYFAGYVLDADTTKSVDDQILLAKSTDENSLVEEQLQKILMDDDSEQTVTSGTPLKLADGYELAIKSIDIDGNKVYVELNKDGAVVDSKVISPSKSDTPTMADKTYYYKKTVGDQKDLVIIGVHFKNAFRGSDQNLATVDGIWQISDVAASVKVDDEYGKMRIKAVTAEGITMDNKDNSITLSKNKQIDLMEGVKIKTADQDDVTAENPLRYYIYKDVTIEGAAAPVVEAAPAVEATPAAEAVTAAAAVAEEKVNESAVVAKEKVEEAATKAEEKVNASATEAAEKATPGFESIFAITGLLAVAFLVLGRKE